MHPKVASDAKIVAIDSGVNLACDSTFDGSRSLCGGSSRSAGILPNTHRRHRRPRDDGRRRKQAPRRGRAGWGSADGNLWPANMFGLPFLYSAHDDHMSYWTLQPNCVGFSQSAIMIDSDWSLPESYKDRFSDLASTQWSRPSFEEEAVEGSAVLLHNSSLDSADTRYIDQTREISPPRCCRSTSEILSDHAAASDIVSTRLLGSDISNSDSSILNDTGLRLVRYSSQDSAAAQNVDQTTEITSLFSRNLASGIGDDCAAASDSVSTQLLGTDFPSSDISNDAGPIQTKSVECQTSLVSVSDEQLVVAAEHLPDDIGNFLLPPHDLRFSVLPNGSFGIIPDANPCLTGISITVDDDPFLGCRPFDPALWSVLNSARMWCGNSSMSRELRLVPSASECSELCSVGLHLFGADSSPYNWNDVESVLECAGCCDVESVLECSGCFDVSDNFSLLSLQNDDGKDTETFLNNDDETTGRSLVTNSVDRLTYTEIIGHREVWDGSRIAEAMLENDGVVTVLGAEAVRQIWQPASCSSDDKISLSGCEEDSHTNDAVCRCHSQPRSRFDRISVVRGSLVEAEVDGHCASKFGEWTDKCHCVSCIWQCELLAGEVGSSPSGTVTDAEHESNPRNDSVEHIVSPLPSSASESSIFWNEFCRDSGSIMKASSTWDSQLFSSDCLEPSSLDHTTSSDELKNGEDCADGKMTKSDAVISSDGSSDDLLAEETSLHLSFLRRKKENTAQLLGENCAYLDNLEHTDSGLDPGDNEEDQQINEFPSGTDEGDSSTEAGETRKFFNPPATDVELNNFATAGSLTAFTAGALYSGCDACSACYPVSSVLSDLLEENNNISSVVSESAVVASSDDCEEIVQLLPSLASVSDIIFSDTDDSLDSELASSDESSVFSSPEPCTDELLPSEAVSDPEAGSLAILDSSSDRPLQLDLGSDLCSTAHCYVGSFLAPVYTLDGSSLWFRDSHYISANIDALSRLRSDLQPSSVWFPTSSVAHDSVCTAMAQCRRLLPSENTAFRDNIPQRLEPLVHLQPMTDSYTPPLVSNIIRQSSGCGAPSPWLWPGSVDESLSLKVVPSNNQFRPIGTPSTTDSELSEFSASTAEAVTTTDSLTDFAAMMMGDMLADSHEVYQRFVISRDGETEGSSGGGGAAECRTFQPSFKVQYELEKAAQTGEPSPPVSVATDVDLRLGCLVKKVLSQLSGEFPEESSNVDDILCDAGDPTNDISCPDEQTVDDTSVTMSRKLSVIWNDAACPGGLDLESSPPSMSSLSAVSCQVSQIWTHSTTVVTDTSSPSFVSIHGRQLSDIWSDTTVQLADSAYVSDTADLLLCGVPDIWKDASQQTRTKSNKLRRMWKSVDSDDVLTASDGGMFNPQSVWNSSRPNSVIAEAETLRPVMEDSDLATYGYGSKSSTTDNHSDQCDISPSDFDIFWGTTSDLKSPTTETDTDADMHADVNIFHGGGLRNGLLGSDDIWSHNETDIRGAECGETDVETSWNVDPLYCSGNTKSLSLPVTGDNAINPHSVTDPLPSWTSSEACLDADVAFAFTHLVSEVVRIMFHLFSLFLKTCIKLDYSLDKFRPVAPLNSCHSTKLI